MGVEEEIEVEEAEEVEEEALVVEETIELSPVLVEEFSKPERELGLIPAQPLSPLTPRISERMGRKI